jgi:hypothetical protein
LGKDGVFAASDIVESRLDFRCSHSIREGEAKNLAEISSRLAVQQIRQFEVLIY